jgi:2-deoxy-D-gluconate 3-dehydrogenase
MPREAWDAVVETHLTGSFLCVKHAAAAMVRQGDGGKIINIGSMYSLYGSPNFVDYAAAKTGILGLTRALAVELARHRIQVNAILPGWFETDMTKGGPASEWGERIRRRTPAARWGRPDDLVGAVVFLASRASDFVTGAALPVDGGYAVADRQLAE